MENRRNKYNEREWKIISWNSANCSHRWCCRAQSDCGARHDHKIPRCWASNSHIIIPKWVIRFVRCAPRTWLKHIFRAVFYLSLARISFPSTARARCTHTHANIACFIRSPFFFFVILERIGRENRASPQRSRMKTQQRECLRLYCLLSNTNKWRDGHRISFVSHAHVTLSYRPSPA